LSWPAWNSHDRFDECPIHLYSVVFYQGNYPILTCCLFSHASLGFLRPCPFQELLPDVLPVFFTSDPLTFPPRGKGPRAGFLEMLGRLEANFYPRVSAVYSLQLRSRSW
jgi:hypothetical protein